MPWSSTTIIVILLELHAVLLFLLRRLHVIEHCYSNYSYRTLISVLYNLEQKVLRTVNC